MDDAQAQLERSSLLRRLAPGGDLYKDLVRSPAIYGSVEGPDYVRVVLEGGEWLTVVVGSSNGRPKVRAFETSSCGLCSEPERYIRDLIAEVQATGDASHRLLPGIELLTRSVYPENEWRRERWIWAYVNRAAGSGHTTRVLRDASVVDSNGRLVSVNLGDRVEIWPLVYLKERWWLDYAGLEEDSVLRMGKSEAESWTRASTVRSARLSNWQPDWRQQEGVVQVSDGALFFVQRGLQEDLLLYDQDMGRRWAMWATLDEREGQVLAKVDAPRLPSRIFVDTIDWPELFRFALSPTGQFLAVAAHNRLWVFDTEAGEVVLERKDLSGAGGLAFSPIGGTLAVLGRAFGALRFFETTGLKRQEESGDHQRRSRCSGLPRGSGFSRNRSCCFKTAKPIESCGPRRWTAMRALPSLRSRNSPRHGSIAQEIKRRSVDSLTMHRAQMPEPCSSKGLERPARSLSAAMAGGSWFLRQEPKRRACASVTSPQQKLNRCVFPPIRCEASLLIRMAGA